MPIDIRAEVSCSLGTVISGSFADDYLQGNGLIKTRGEVVLDGTQTPEVGTEVTFTYAKSGSTYTVPRVLRVLSSFADPFRRTTTVQLGCKLTYLENRKPPVENPSSKDENSTVPCKVFLQATLPISAEYVFQQCLDALELDSADIPLTNKFSVEEFDLTPGYIQVMSDLLQSEGYAGYLDSNETLQFLDLTEEASTGPVITPSDVVDLGPIGSGELPGESVVVRWSNLRLLPPDELYGDEYLKRSWEIEEVFGAPSEVTVSYTDDEGNTQSDSDVFYPFSFAATRYDVWDRKIESISLNLVSSAETNNRWASDAFRQGRFWNLPTARLTREVVEYEKAAAAANNANLMSVQQVGGGVNDIKAQLGNAAEAHTGLANLCKEEVPEGADVVKSQTTYNYFSELELAGSLNIDSYISDSGSLVVFDTIAAELDSFVVVEYETDTSSGISKTITKRSVSRSQTVSGQQDLATRAQELDTADLSNSISSLLTLARRQIYVGAETSLHTQREYGLQKRPSEADRNNTANSKPQISESKAEITWIVGSTTSTAVTEFTLPYAPDDAISWDAGTQQFSSTPSDADQKAMRYGRVQNALLLGNRNGVSLQLAPDQLPKRPFDPLYLQAGGITGAYRVNGTSWAFDANGIVASTDALLWGAVSAASGTNLASSWVPLAPGTTSLPLPYTPSSGGIDSETGVTYSAVITPTVVLAPYLESVKVEGISRSTVVLTDYPYTLDRGTTEIPVVAKTSAVTSSVVGPVVLAQLILSLDAEALIPVEDITVTRTITTRLKPSATPYGDTLAVVGYYSSPYIKSGLSRAATFDALANPAVLPYRVFGTAISPDGTRLVMSYTQSNSQLHWYTIANNVLTKETPPSDQPYGRGRVRFSSSGQYLLITYSWQSPWHELFLSVPSGFTKVGTVLDPVPSTSIGEANFSLDDHYIVAVYATVTHVYQRDSMRWIGVATANTPSTAYAVGISPDNALVATGTGASPYLFLHSFDGTNLTAITHDMTIPARVNKVSFSPEGRYIAVSHNSGLLVFRRDSTTTYTQIYSTTNSANTHRWGYNDTVLIGWGTNMHAYAIDLTTDTVTDKGQIYAYSPYDKDSLDVYPKAPLKRAKPVFSPKVASITTGLTVKSFDPSDVALYDLGTEAPRLGNAMATTYSGWTLLFDGDIDDDFVSTPITLPFNVTINGAASNSIYVNSNSAISFGSGDGSIFYYDYPATPKIMVAVGDYSLQKVYTKSTSEYVIIRWEGYHEYSGYSGTTTVIWEMAIPRPDPTTGDQVIEVRMGDNFALADFWFYYGDLNVCDAAGSLGSTGGDLSERTTYIATSDSSGAVWTVQSGYSLQVI